MPSSADPFAPLVERLQSAARVTLLTGAGVSVASGIPTFRGTNGLWRRHRPESLATPEAFAKDPKLVWEWYVWRRRKVAACKPNLAHEVIAAWSRRYPAFSLITQNVDGLHELAGTTNVLRMHGSLWEMSCWDQCAGSPGRWEDRRTELDALPPRCPHCLGLLRPGVVWFGESLDPDVLRQCDAALDCDIFMTIGTSSVVYPAASLAPEAKRRGAFTVEINPEATLASNVLDLSIRQSAESALAAIEQRLAG